MRHATALFLALLLASPLGATTYYVDATGGSDAAGGTTTGTAWKTIAKVNATTLAADDIVLFKRGEVWLEQLTVPSSGSAGHPIVFGAYGTGALPTIRGDNPVTGEWISVGTNLWQATITHADSSVYALWNNGVLGTRVATVAAINGAGKWQKFIGAVSDTLYLYATSQPTAVATSNRTCVYANSKSYVTLQNLRFVRGYSSDSLERGNVQGGTGWVMSACQSDSSHNNGAYNMPYIYNSVFINNRLAATYNGTIEAKHNTMIGGATGVQRPVITGMSIKNNIFSGQTSQFIDFTSSAAPYAPTIADHVMAGNIYSAASLTNKWKTKAGTLFSTLAAWADSTGDASTQAGDIDLKFTAAATGDYSLLAASPAVDAGVTGLSVTTDFAGATRDATPDIGAYEYATDAPAPVPIFRAGQVFRLLTFPFLF